MEMNLEIIIKTITELSLKKDGSVHRALKNAGVKTTIVDNLKKGSFPSIDKVYQLAEYFNVSVDYLLKGADYCSRIEQDIITRYRNYFNVDKLGPNQEKEIKADLELMKMFHMLNKIGKKALMNNAEGYIEEKDFINCEAAKETLA